MIDLDQGGLQRNWTPQWCGPSVGWIWVPTQEASLAAITVPGTYNIDLSTTLVTVNVAGSVTVNLPAITFPTYGGAGMAQPGRFAIKPVTIVDIGGNAGTFAITIAPASGENIMGLTSITISIDYGGYTLNPSSPQKGWTSISP